MSGNGQWRGTERIEVAGYREVPNIEGSRIRQGVLLVIAEGLCLKAPKIKKHTDRLGVQGWEFIDTLASKGKNEDQKESKLKQRYVKPDSRYMGDIIAGRPVFGEPSNQVDSDSGTAEVEQQGLPLQDSTPQVCMPWGASSRWALR